MEREVQRQMNENPENILTFQARQAENIALIIRRVHGTQHTESDLLWYAGKPWKRACDRYDYLFIPLSFSFCTC